MKASKRGNVSDTRRQSTARHSVFYVAMLAVLGGPANAARIDYQIEATLLNSDNIGLTESNEQDDTVFVPRLSFWVDQEGSAVRIQARGGIEYRDYLDDTFSDETRGEFAGQLNWEMFPQRLNFVVEDYLSHEPISLDEGTNPTNVQRVNVLLGGPSLYLRFNETTRAQLDLRAAENDAEVTDTFDGNRLTAVFGLEREFSSTSVGSLNFVGSDVEFDSSFQAVDYDRRDAFVRYRREFADFDFHVDLGHSWLDPEGLRADESTPLARATLGWRISPSSLLRLRVRHQYADTVQDLVVRQDDLGDAELPELAEYILLIDPGVYEQRQLDVDYRYRGDRLVFLVRPLYRRLRYLETQSDDRDVRGVFAQFEYRLRPRLSLNFQARAYNQDFLGRNREDRDRVYSLGAEYQWTRHLSWRAEVLRNERDSTDFARRYDENAVLLSVVWRR